MVLLTVHGRVGIVPAEEEDTMGPVESIVVKLASDITRTYLVGLVQVGLVSLLAFIIISAAVAFAVERIRKRRG